ncbi:MAG: phage major capsid protein [Dehalococcoidales bacterium]|nr:phage major capsid protein [Dehalococcoidales bacterium]
MGDKIKELLEKRANIWEQAKELVDRAEAENRDFTAEEQVQYDKMFDEMDSLAKRAKRLEEQEKEERELDKPVNNPIKATLGEKDDRAAKVMDAFRSYIMTGAIKPELRDLQVLSGETPADATWGGYMVPPQQFIAELIKALDNAVFMRRIARVFQVTTSDSLGAPVLDVDMSDAAWTTEVQDLTGAGLLDTAMRFDKRELKPQQLAKSIKVSMKLLRVSAIPVEALVRDRLVYKFATAMENAFLNGAGTTEPLGVFTASVNGISTARDFSTGNTTTAISADNLIEVKYALKAQYRNGAQWIFHRDAIKMISKLKDGEGQYLWQQGLAAGQPDTILNLPVNESEYAPSTFATGQYVGILGNFQFYWIAELFGMEIQRLSELFAATSQVGFIGRMWADGAPVLEEAFARVKLA